MKPGPYEQSLPGEMVGNDQKCWQLAGCDIPGAAYAGLRRRIAEVAHIPSEGCHGRQTERKRREWTSLKRISKDECAVTFPRYPMIRDPKPGNSKGDLTARGLNMVLPAFAWMAGKTKCQARASCSTKEHIRAIDGSVPVD